MLVKELLCLVVVLGFIATVVEGHGYLLDPPARGSAWRKGFGTPTDTNDMANFCGGRGTQHDQVNKGRCGVCGEEYSNPSKKLEPGPANKYATGTIVASYNQGDTIDVTVVATAFHMGCFEFRLCQNNVPQKGSDSSIAVTLDCLNKNVLVNADTGDTKFAAAPGTSTHRVTLPSDVTCSDCVFQWRYRTGNNWGCETENGVKKCGSGLGGQEEFIGCADITIEPVQGQTNAPTTDKPATSEMATTEKQTTEKPTTEKPTTEMPTTEMPTTEMPSTEMPSTEMPTTEMPTTEIPTKKPTTEEPTTKKPVTEKPTTEMPATDKPTTQIATTEKPATQKATTKMPTTEKPTTEKPTTEAPVNEKSTPKAKSQFEDFKKTKKVCIGISDMFHVYCQINCNHVPAYCPPSHCQCE